MTPEVDSFKHPLKSDEDLTMRRGVLSRAEQLVGYRHGSCARLGTQRHQVEQRGGPRRLDRISPSNVPTRCLSRKTWDRASAVTFGPNPVTSFSVNRASKVAADAIHGDWYSGPTEPSEIVHLSAPWKVGYALGRGDGEAE